MGLQFNRNVSPELLAELRPGGQFEGLVRRRNELPALADVQLRRAQGPECHASLYIGLTSVLNLRERRGEFALSAHKTHRAAGGFEPSWSAFQSAASLAGDWPAVEAYLDRLLAKGGIDPRWYRREGVLHALLCSGQSTAYGVVQREAAPWADGPPLVRDVVDATSDLIWAASQAGGRTEPWWPGIRDSGIRKPMGDELDVLAVGDDGRLLCMEAKPAEETAGIVWSVAQVLVYANCSDGGPLRTQQWPHPRSPRWQSSGLPSAFWTQCGQRHSPRRFGWCLSSPLAQACAAPWRSSDWRSSRPSWNPSLATPLSIPSRCGCSTPQVIRITSGGRRRVPRRRVGASPCRQRCCWVPSRTRRVRYRR